MAFCILRVFFGVYLMEIMINQYIEAAPAPSVPIDHIRWATPCTPNVRNAPSNMALLTVNENTNENVVILKSKTEDAIQQGNDIKKILTDIFQDSHAIKMIKDKNLNGFPEAVIGDNKVSIGDKFRNIYTQLSNSAVFLDHIYHMQSEGELKRQLEIIINNNLSLMCELTFVLIKVVANRPDPANRSIMGDLPTTMSSFQKNERSLNTIFKYEALLSKHLEWYSELKTNTDS